MSDDGELDLNSLNDEELVQQVHDDLYDGLKEEVEVAVHILLKRGWTPYKVLTEALVEGMRIVGVDFRDGIPENWSADGEGLRNIALRGDFNRGIAVFHVNLEPLRRSR